MKFQAFNLLKPYSPGTLPQTCYRENSKLHLPKVQPNVIIFCRIRPDPTSGSCVLTLAVSNSWLFATPWTIARQPPLSLGFSRQEYWSGLPFPFPGNLPNPGIEPEFLALQLDSLLPEPYENICMFINNNNKYLTAFYISSTVVEIYYD